MELLAPHLPRFAPPFKSLLGFLAVLLCAGTVVAHNLDQANTHLGFDDTTVDRLENRFIAGQPLIQMDDELNLIFKSTPGPGTNVGAGGYFTFYIPPGTQVIGVDYGRPNGTGGFTVLPLKPPAEMPLGDGAISSSVTSALNGLVLGPNITGQSAAAVAANGVHNGTLAGVYGDVGIFYATDPSTAWQTFVTSGGYDGNPATNDNLLVNNSGNPIIPSNRWDAAQLIAFGMKSPAAPLVDPNGRGTTPWGMGSPVAGPQSGYAWSFNWDYWRANPTHPARMKNAIQVGPWQRIRYPGSTVAVDQPGLKSVVRGLAVADASGLGVPVNSSAPLPPTLNWTDATSPKAVRIAYGQLVIGTSEYGRIRLKVLANAGEPGSPFGPDGSITFHSDVSGGDAGGESNGKDHVWRYVKSAPLSLSTASLFQKRFVKTPLQEGDSSYFDLVVANTGAGPLTNVVLRDPMPSGLTFVSASESPVSTNPLRWNLGTIPPQGFRKIRVNYTATTRGTRFNIAQLTWDGGTKYAMDSVDVTRTGIPTGDDDKNPTMSLGNLVFRDYNGDGKASPGEGLPNAQIELYYGDDVPGVDPPRNTQLTAADGSYLFTYLEASEYKVHLPAWQFQPGAPLYGLFGVPGVGETDDNAGEDGLDEPKPWEKGITSREVTLAVGFAPTASGYETGFQAGSDDSTDDLCDLTIDLGLFYGVGIGNLVFFDTNANGSADPGEGYDGVTLELYRADQTPGVDVPLATTTSANGGLYLFAGLPSGNYRVHIGKEMFTVDTPLYGAISIPESISGDDDVGDNGGALGDLSQTGVTSDVFFIGQGSAPTALSGETGFESTLDDQMDAAIDLTIDFGFQRPMKVGNVVFQDDNHNGRHDSGEGVAGVPLHLFKAGQNPLAELPVLETLSDAAGRYEFGFLHPDSYFVFVPPAAFLPGGPLANQLSVPGANPAQDDDLSEDGIDDISPELQGIRTAPFTLTQDQAPTDGTGETGAFAAEDNLDDANANLTIDLGFVTRPERVVGLGNMVFIDADGDRAYDPDEGVADVLVHLYSAGSVPGEDAPVAMQVTRADGFYWFWGLEEAGYFVHLPEGNFLTGGPLAGVLSLPGDGGDNGADDDLDENGIDDPEPALRGIRSGDFVLEAGTEPSGLNSEIGSNAFVDDPVDTSSDLSIDFGFFRPLALGNLVFIDRNGNGVADSGEGAAGVPVELHAGAANPNDSTPLATTTTDANGEYRFDGLTAGEYCVHIPAEAFGYGAPLFAAANLTGTTAGDDSDGEDGEDSDQPDWFGVSAAPRYLAPGTAPADTEETGWNAARDDFRDADVDLTVDFGFSQSALFAIAGQVRIDADADGDPGDPDPPLSGLLLRLFHDANQDGFADDTDGSSEYLGEVQTDGDGRFTFTGLPSGTYLIVQSLDTPGITLTAQSVGPPSGVLAVTLAEADADGLFFLNHVEPSGYIYDSFTGTLVSGGTVSVSGPGQVTMLLDGSQGAYSWVTDGTPGLYTLSYQPPPLYRLDPDRGSELLALVPGGQPSPLRIGSGIGPGSTLVDAGAQSNPWYVAFELAAGDPVVTRNNLPLRRWVPKTWPEWLENHNISEPARTLTGDADQDGVSHLLEFAAALPPDSGVQLESPLVIEQAQATGKLTAKIRRVAGIEGVTYTLEGIADLSQSPAGWFDIDSTLSPVVESVDRGVEQVVYTDLEQVPGLSGGKGFVRLRIQSDAAMTGEAAATTTETWGWVRQQRPAGHSSYSTFARSAPLIQGTAGGFTSNSIDLAGSLGATSLATLLRDGRQFYAEMLTGPYAGYWSEVDELASDGSTLRIAASGNAGSLPSPLPDVTGQRLRVVPHRRLQDEVPAASVLSTNNPSTATRLLFFERQTQQYQSFWAFANAGSPFWALVGGNLADQGQRSLPPAEGMLLQARADGLQTVAIGQVSDRPLVLRLNAGYQLLGSPWPLAQSPIGRAMTGDNHFTGSGNASTSDQFLLWAGDSNPGASGYQTYYFLKSGPFSQWTLQGDATLQNRGLLNLLLPSRAVFVRPLTAQPAWKIPVPWTPQ
jgi:uncharacterized repeat protein (TIGR01451 family)